MTVEEIQEMILRKRQILIKRYGAKYVAYSTDGRGEIILMDENKKIIDNLTHLELWAL